MVVARTIGPKVTQIVLYNDATYGEIPAIITKVPNDGSVTLTTFPPGASPQTQTEVNYDYTGAIVGRWRYHETDVI